MGNFKFAWRKDSLPTPLCRAVLVGKSIQIEPGDVLVQDTGAAFTGTGGTQYPIARPLLSTDTITTSNGLLGVALYALTTNSAGEPAQPKLPITIDQRSRIDPQLLSIPHALPEGRNTYYQVITVAAFDPVNVFHAYMQSDDVAGPHALGRILGVLADAASFPSNYYTDDDAADANAPLICEGLDTTDPKYNAAGGGVFVSCRASFYQGNTGGGFTLVTPPVVDPDPVPSQIPDPVPQIGH